MAWDLSGNIRGPAGATLTLTYDPVTDEPTASINGLIRFNNEDPGSANEFYVGRTQGLEIFGYGLEGTSGDVIVEVSNLAGKKIVYAAAVEPVSIFPLPVAYLRVSVWNVDTWAGDFELTEGDPVFVNFMPPGNREAAVASRALEGQPVIIYGHSAVVDAYNTPGNKWFQKVQKRLHLGPVLSRATGGFDNFQMLERMFGVVKPAYSWVPGTKGIVVLMAGGNEQIQGNGNAGLLQHLKDSIYASVAWLQTETFVHVNDMVRVGTWTEQSNYQGVPQGKYRHSATAGDTATATVTGDTITVFFNTWDGVIVNGRNLEIRIDGELYADIDTETAATTAEWGDTMLGGGIACRTFRNLGDTEHTVECRVSSTLSGGSGTPAVAGVIGVGVKSTKPPIVVVFADAKAPAPYGGDTEYANILNTIQNALYDYGEFSSVRLIEANDGMPTSGLTGADGVHGNDLWEAHMAQKLETELLTITELPYEGTPGSILPGMGEPVATYSYPGALVVGAGVVKVPMPKSFVLLGAWAYVNTAPTGAALIVDINKNGTSVYTNANNRPTVAVSTNAAQYPKVPYSTVGGFNYPVVFDSGDVLSVDIDQVGSAVAGSDLTVVIEGIYR